METQPVKALIVEDDLVFVALLRRFFVAEIVGQVSLAHASTLADALTRLAQEPFDLILLDLNLEDSLGLATLTRLRAQAPLLPIVILTGSDNESLALEAIRQGAQDYLIKGQVEGRMLGRAMRYAIERKRVEEALREREEFFRLISENVQDLIAVLDCQGRRLYNSPSYKALLGEPAALVGTLSFLDIDPQDRGRVQHIFQETVATGTGQNTEYRLRLKDGTVRFVESRGSLIHDAAGRPAKVVVVSRDITERKRAEAELQERETFFRLISENMSDMIAVIDKDGRRLYNSPSYARLFGDLNSLRGTDSFQEIHPEDRARIRSVFETTLASGMGQRTEFRFQLRDGSLRYIESQGSVIKDEAGAPAKVVVVSRDITERKQAEEALRASEQRFKRLLASTTDYIFSVRVEQGIPVATTHGPGCATVTGYTPADYAADPILWYRMVHVDDRDAVIESACRVRAGHAPPPLEHRIIHKDGSTRWVKNTAVPTKDAQGRVIAYDGLISDITERKQAELRLQAAYGELAASEQSLRKALADLEYSHAELQRAQMHLIQAEKMESVGTMAAGVAHEVKNPLQIILLGVQYLSRLIPAQDVNGRRVLEDMRGAVSRADTIVRGLLEFSASHQLEVKEESLNRVIDQAFSLVNYELSQHRIALTKELADRLPLLRLDRIKMEQVFINLFLNALQAMPHGGALSVRTYAQPSPVAAASDDGLARSSAVVAEVDDTGKGIPPEKLGKVFDPFFTTKPPGKGTGLGLTVVRKIVELHGGSIQLQNRSEGGVRVTLLLPIKT